MQFRDAACVYIYSLDGHEGVYVNPPIIDGPNLDHVQSQGHPRIRIVNHSKICSRRIRHPILCIIIIFVVDKSACINPNLDR